MVTGDSPNFLSNHMKNICKQIIIIISGTASNMNTIRFTHFLYNLLLKIKNAMLADRKSASKKAKNNTVNEYR